MGLGEKIISTIENRREQKSLKLKGPLGDFYRQGGNALLYQIPAEFADRVIDAGGYKGEWTSQIFIRYGCKIDIFEPILEFSETCIQLFEKNPYVNVHRAALGKKNGNVQFHLNDNGTSAFLAKNSGERIDCKVMDISDFIGIDDEPIACLKLNIEGGEYDVLERVIETGLVKQLKSILIQFHRQPEDWEIRMSGIVESLESTHVREWYYPMIWEKWTLK